MTMQPAEYLDLLEQKGITPNWWCSEEYFEKAQLGIVVDENKVIVIDGDQQMFPSLSLKEGEVWGENDYGFWADFPEYLGQEFLDYEYIYDPRQFLKMEGRQWMAFRKNCRKFPARIGEKLEYGFWLSNESQLKKLIRDWAKKIKDIADADVLLEYVFHGQNRKMLIGQSNGELYGVNIWDENYRFINFRYSICSGEPFLAEYLRLLFYQDMANRDKLVNDGGILDRPNLKLFKDKMNPVRIREIKGMLSRIMKKSEI